MLFRSEAEYYQKALELDKTIPFALNNYGYAIYKQKKYQAARDVFMQCIEEKKDMPYAGNNYVKCLLALGRYKDAKDFIKSTDLKISKTIQDQVKKKASTNQRLKKETEEVAEEFKDSEVDSQAEPKNSAKLEQFSNEKLLEDELTARIESGYKKIPQITDFTDENGTDHMKQVVQENYERIKAEAGQIGRAHV